MPNPVARNQGLLVEELDDELVICDVERDVVHGLNGPAARCWQALDGTKNIPELAAHLYPTLPTEAATRLVRLGIRTLDDKHLLAQGIPSVNISRRDCLAVLRQHGIKAAGVVVAVSSVVSPSPSMAQSGGVGNGDQCEEDSACASGCCNSSNQLCCASADGDECDDGGPCSG